MNALAPDSPLVTKVLPSPNQNERRDGRRPDMIVLHYTGMVDAASAVQRLTNPLAEVSSHYLVFEDGRIFQLVSEAARAWHAGVSIWAGERDLNSSSIGIEIVNPGHDGGYPDYPAVQVDAVSALCRDIAERHRIPAVRILAHSDIAPLRKADPGEKFPWHRLAADGVGHWVPPAAASEGRSFARGDEGQPIQALQALLRMYGYGIEITGVFDDLTEAVVTAFQRHFRPARVDGIADASTLATLRDLLAARPV
ncbi:N-acetylmuramoyl-L-alanine amidase [Alsobacter sp. R-9]